MLTRLAMRTPLRRPLQPLRPLVRGARNASTPTPSPLRMPPDMPREDYATPASYAINTLSTVVKYIVYGGLGIGITLYAGYEGMHLYVENVSLAAPSRSTPDDIYGWADENLPFTGGVKGGTDPRLGWKARHALRGAWIAWEWGAGEASAIQKRSVHPDLKNTFIGRDRQTRIDRGYQLADEYIDLATEKAKAIGLVFPLELEHLGPPAKDSKAPPPCDPTALDLLTLKAGILERMNTPDTLAYAKDVYERLLHAENGATAPVEVARVVRLAHKIGDLAQRGGDIPEAHKWWDWGLERAGIAVPHAAKPTGGSGWWPFGGKTTSPAAVPAPSVPAMCPALRRATTSILISASAANAQTGALDRAAQIQAFALAALPSPTWVNGRLGISVPTSSTAPETLQATWEASRAALLDLHRASVAHARNDKTLNPLVLSGDAADHADAVVTALTPTIPAAYIARGSPEAQPAERLLRDTMLTAAEAYFTHAVLLERAAGTAKPDDQVHELEHASEAYERAMSLSAAESGTTDARNLGDEDAVGRGEEWARYWRGYVRTREKIMKIVTEAAEGKKADK